MRPSQPGPSVPSPSRRSLLRGAGSAALLAGTGTPVLAAGSLLTAIPTLAVYFALQRQFVSGLTLGSNKG